MIYIIVNTPLPGPYVLATKKLGVGEHLHYNAQ